MIDLYSVSQSTIHLFGVELVIHHLNNGQRVIEQGSMNALFEAMAKPGGASDPDINGLLAILSGDVT